MKVEEAGLVQMSSLPVVGLGSRAGAGGGGTEETGAGVGRARCGFAHAKPTWRGLAGAYGLETWS